MAGPFPHLPFVYILRCSDDSFYVGHTENLTAKIEAHKAGAGSTYTAARRPIELVFHETHASLESAVARERQLKRWSSAKEEALASGGFARHRQLAKRGGNSR